MTVFGLAVLVRVDEELHHIFVRAVALEDLVHLPIVLLGLDDVSVVLESCRESGVVRYLNLVFLAVEKGEGDVLIVLGCIGCHLLKGDGARLARVPQLGRAVEGRHIARPEVHDGLALAPRRENASVRVRNDRCVLEAELLPKLAENLMWAQAWTPREPAEHPMRTREENFSKKPS